MTEPDPPKVNVPVRLLASVVALTAGVVALVVAIELVRGVLG